MNTLETIKTFIPDYAADIRASLDAILGRSALPANEAAGVALATAMAKGNMTLAKAFAESGALDETEIAAAKTAAALMGMANAWFAYTDLAGDAELEKQPPGLSLQAYAKHGGVDERRFEMWTLAASIVGRCRACTNGHAENLRKLGVSTRELREVGRIAAVVSGAANILSAEGHR